MSRKKSFRNEREELPNSESMRKISLTCIMSCFVVIHFREASLQYLLKTLKKVFLSPTLSCATA